MTLKEIWAKFAYKSYYEGTAIELANHLIKTGQIIKTGNDQYEEVEK